MCCFLLFIHSFIPVMRKLVMVNCWMHLDWFYSSKQMFCIWRADIKVWPYVSGQSWQSRRRPRILGLSVCNACSRMSRSEPRLAGTNALKLANKNVWNGWRSAGRGHAKRNKHQLSFTQTETRGGGRTGTRYLLRQNAGAESDSGISVCNQSGDMCLQSAISPVKPNVPLKAAHPNTQKTATADCDVDRSEVWSECVSGGFVCNCDHLLVCGWWR